MVFEVPEASKEEEQDKPMLVASLWNQLCRQLHQLSLATDLEPPYPLGLLGMTVPVADKCEDSWDSQDQNGNDDSHKGPRLGF